MMNKDYLFDPSGLPPSYPRGQLYDRQQWNQSPLLQASDKSRRDQVWEMKKQQRFHQPIDNSLQYESPSLGGNYNSYDQANNYSNIENFPEYSYEQPRVDYNDPPVMNSNIKSEYMNPDEISRKIQNDKRKMYAEELRRQIEEKNKLKMNEKSRRVLEKNENQEINIHSRFASAGRKNISGQGNDDRMLEREKKLQYARELEAQIQQKRLEGNKGRRIEEPAPIVQESNKKNIYMRDFEGQSSNRNSSEHRAFNLPEYKREVFSSQIEVERIPIRRENEGYGVKNSNQAEFDKKLWYKQELEKQIEEQKKRKEEEKLKKQKEDEIVERNIFCERNEKKAGDKKNLYKGKDSFEDVNLIKHNVHSIDRKAESELFENPSRKMLDDSASDSSFDLRKPSNLELPPQYAGYRAANEILTPFGQEKSAKALNIPKSPVPSYEPRNQMMENYIKEIQEIRKERDIAKEQCLEMREMMLREKEKNLEQMLSLMRNKSNDSLNPDKGNIDKPGFISSEFMKNKRDEGSKVTLSKNPSGYAQAVYDQVQKDLFMPTDFNPGEYPSNIRKFQEQSNYEKPEPFEKSLVGQSKFVDAKWQEPGFENLHRQEKPRKKWDNYESNPSVPFEPLSMMPKYKMDQEFGHLEEISEDKESLPGKSTQLSFFETKQKTEDDNFFQNFQEKYAKNGFMAETDENPELDAVKEEINKLLNEVNEVKENQGSRITSARGQRAFSRLQEARKHAQELESEPKNEELRPPDSEKHKKWSE